MTDVPVPPRAPEPNAPDEAPADLQAANGPPGGPMGLDVVPGTGRIDLNVGEDAGDLGDIAADGA